MNTLIFRREGDGHKVVVSDDGQKVGFGDRDLNVVHVPNPAAVWPIGEGRDLQFLSNDLVTWTRDVPDGRRRWVADLRMFDGGQPTGELPWIVAGNKFVADKGHWASVLLPVDRSQRRLTYDGVVVKQGYVDDVEICGDYMVTIEGEPRKFVVYHQGAVQREHPLPPNANKYRVSDQGWITFGYYGPCGLITPEGRVHDITVTPWKQEGVAKIVHLPNGFPWAWSATVAPSSKVAQVVGRPILPLNGGWFTDTWCIQILFPAEYLDVAWYPERSSFTVAGSANLGTSTPVEVHVVPITSNRVQLKDEATEPPPEEEEVNAPGITITHWDPVLTQGGDHKYEWFDRNNPQHQFRITFKGGHFRVEMTYDGWQTKIDRSSATSRYVDIKD